MSTLSFNIYVSFNKNVPNVLNDSKHLEQMVIAYFLVVLKSHDDALWMIAEVLAE